MKICTTIGKFRWNNLDRNNSVLKMPIRCQECEVSQRQSCIERSWQSQGKLPSQLRNVKVDIQFTPDNKEATYEEEQSEDECAEATAE